MTHANQEKRTKMKPFNKVLGCRNSTPALRNKTSSRRCFQRPTKEILTGCSGFQRGADKGGSGSIGGERSGKETAVQRCGVGRAHTHHTRMPAPAFQPGNEN